MLVSTKTENIADKSGAEKEYLVGTFYDMHDNVHEIVLKPDDAEQILECGLGTIVEIDVKEVREKSFAIGLKFIDKRPKNIAA